MFYTLEATGYELCKPETEGAVEFFYGGLTGTATAWINRTDQDITISEPELVTVACGWSERIIVRAHAALIKAQKGGPRDFARYDACSIEQVEAFAAEYGSMERFNK